MKISQNGIELIKSHEGLVLSAYKAVESEIYWTIGYGHYGVDVAPNMRISRLEAEELLKKDVLKFEREVNNLVKVPVTQNQFDSLVSFTYNVGINAFKNSTLLKLLNRKDYSGASAEFPRWNKSGGVVLKGLVKRREKEQALFNKGVMYGILVDGIWGKETTIALQDIFHTPKDGIISKQHINKYNEAIRTLDKGEGGSILIRSMQKWLNVKVDGYIGANTIKALQHKIGVPVDGFIGKITVKQLQRKINEGNLL